MAIATILLSEETNYGYHFFAEELRKDGYLVASTANGQTLLDSIETVQPDLLIVDADPFSLRGLDVLQVINDEHYDLPVIIWCADGNPSFDPRSIRADYMVSKSCDISELKKKISLALSEKSGLPSGGPGEAID
jgi:DNA-binding response OmpR family regulator